MQMWTHVCTAGHIVLGHMNLVWVVLPRILLYIV